MSVSTSPHLLGPGSSNSTRLTVDTSPRWQAELDHLCRRISSRFARTEAKARARAYLIGLLSEVERKNAWQLAEQLGDSHPYGIQHFLGRAQWEADLVRDDLRDYVLSRLADPQAVLVIDETGFLKKGNHSVGVQRQYYGTTGQIENCQVGVFLVYATPQSYTFLDRELYLPKRWANDIQRRQEVGIPETVQFATKAQLARQLLERTLAAGVSAAWVTADEVYGHDCPLRLWLEQCRQAYVLTVPTSTQVWVDALCCRIDELAASWPEEEWVRLSCGEGSKGPREYEWIAMPLSGSPAPTWQRWGLVRRKCNQPQELDYFLVFAPAHTTLSAMVEVVGRRWTIETCFETAKGEVGLDQYEVRSWPGWYRHITMAMLAHAYLTVMQADDPAQHLQKKGA